VTSSDTSLSRPPAERCDLVKTGREKAEEKRAAKLEAVREFADDEHARA
jgi:hypothetical protein